MSVYSSSTIVPSSEIEATFSITAEEYFNNQSMTVNVFNSKYALTKLNGALETPGESWWRVSSYIASAELYDGATLAEATALAEIWFWMMWNKEMIPGGRIIAGSLNPDRPSLVNCTTIALGNAPESPIEFGDSIEGIYTAAKQMARVLSKGEGVGIDVTALRPDGARVYNAAKTTSGAVSWMELYDLTTGTVAQNGRRGALLISLKISHPEVLKFIKIKSDLAKINNANISLQITDDFMQAVVNDADWDFTWSNEAKNVHIKHTVRAKDIMYEIAHHSSKFAEPGLQFFDTASRYSNSNAIGYPVISTNACSEQFLTHLDSCVLGHANWANLPLNLEEAKEEAAKRGYYISWFLDNVVTKQLEDNLSPLPGSAEKSRLLRRIGQGFTGIADYLSKRNVAYDSPEGKRIAGELTAAMTRGAYKRSIQAGHEKGSFGAFDAEAIKKSQFIQDMMEEGIIPKDFTALRNVCNITVAPVGSGNLMVNGWANGVEPGIGYIYWRRTRVSGEYVWYFFINPFVYELIQDKAIVDSLKTLEAQINSFEPSEKRFQLEDEAFELLAKANIDLNVHKFSHLVDPMKKADLMGVIQRYVDSAISVTFNMPETATVEDIEKLYIKCWENKLKGVAIYREDPQNREPIFAFKRPKSYNYAPKKVAENTPSVWDNNFSDLEYSELIEFLKTNERIVAKRPQKLHGFTETVKAENHKFYFTYNFDENENLYEVFCQSNSKEPKVSTENAQNVLTALLERNDVPELLIEEQIEKSTHQSSPIKITRLISLGLRHGVTVEEIVQSLEELQVSVVSYIFHLRRSLSQFVKSRVSECPNCKEQTMIIEGGCKHCENCSYSGC